MKHLLSIKDLSARDIAGIFRRTSALKGKSRNILKGRTLVLLFSKPSTRTRVSFDAAIHQLGGHPIYLDMLTSQLGRGETIPDTARVLGAYADGIIARLFRHEDMLELAGHAGIPVINGLTDLLHPCQALSDLYTVREKVGHLKGVKLAFVGDGGSNVCHSLMYGCSKLGVDMSVSCPGKYQPDKRILAETGAAVVRNPGKAVSGADIIYTDAWVSMGDEREKRERVRTLRPYQVNKRLLESAGHCLVMHCMPAHRGQEITGDVIDGERSIVFGQAENRLHVQKGILAELFSP